MRRPVRRRGVGSPQNDPGRERVARIDGVPSRADRVHGSRHRRPDRRGPVERGPRGEPDADHRFRCGLVPPPVVGPRGTPGGAGGVERVAGRQRLTGVSAVAPCGRTRGPADAVGTTAYIAPANAMSAVASPRMPARPRRSRGDKRARR
ncbi:hypothetical protein GPN2_20112 [Streptomyces murinus]